MRTWLDDDWEWTWRLSDWMLAHPGGKWLVLGITILLWMGSTYFLLSAAVERISRWWLIPLSPAFLYLTGAVITGIMFQKHYP